MFHDSSEYVTQRHCRFSFSAMAQGESAHKTREHALLNAVLEKGVNDYFKVVTKGSLGEDNGRKRKTLRVTERQCQALRECIAILEWMTSDSDEPFSYLWICEQLFDDGEGMARQILNKLDKKAHDLHASGFCELYCLDNFVKS